MQKSTAYKPKNITIIGFGRFGKLLAQILNPHVPINIWDKTPAPYIYEKKKYKALENIKNLVYSDVVILAVPINQLASITKQIAPILRPNTLVMDVASVKELPAKIMQKTFTENIEILNTHPMFGPDSAQNGLKDLRIVLCKTRTKTATYKFWKDFLKKQGLQTIEMTPKEHDKLAANSQGITHLIGRILEDMKIEKTPIDTLGYRKLLEVKQQTENDTWELFTDLQNQNTFTKQMRNNFRKSTEKIINKLYPLQQKNKYLTIGIQGGPGSFNEEAIHHYAQKHDIRNYKLKYLYTSRKVLKALNDGEIDRGQFAIQNSIGGTVKETINALSEFNCKILDEFEIEIDHCLLTQKEIPFGNITTIMSHPQAIAQCKNTIKNKYSELHITSGTRELIDQASAAKALSENKIKKDTAIIASKICAKLYNLKIVDAGLQDRKDNFTSFLFVKRR